MNWYLAVLKNYAGFSGRARRAEFWQFALIHFIIYIVLYAVGFAMHNFLLVGLYWLATIVPFLAVSARRLHDTGRSGWWSLLWFTCIGWIALIIFWAQEGPAQPNEHGPSPKHLQA